MEELLNSLYSGQLSLEAVVVVIQLAIIYSITNLVTKVSARFSDSNASRLFYWVRYKTSRKFKPGTRVALDVGGTIIFEGTIESNTFTRLRIQNLYSDDYYYIKISTFMDKDVVVLP